jgi:hypothetical protein
LGKPGLAFDPRASIEVAVDACSSRRGKARRKRPPIGERT